MEILNKQNYSKLEIVILLNDFLKSHNIIDKAYHFNSDMVLEEIRGVKYEIKEVLNVDTGKIGYILQMTYADTSEQLIKFYNDIENLIIELLNDMVDFRDFLENYDFCIFRYNYMKNRKFETLAFLLQDYIFMKETFDKSF